MLLPSVPMASVLNEGFVPCPRGRPVSSLPKLNASRVALKVVCKMFFKNRSIFGRSEYCGRVVSPLCITIPTPPAASSVSEPRQKVPPDTCNTIAMRKCICSRTFQSAGSVELKYIPDTMAYADPFIGECSHKLLAMTSSCLEVSGDGLVQGIGGRIPAKC